MFWRSKKDKSKEKEKSKRKSRDSADADQQRSAVPTNRHEIEAVLSSYLPKHLRIKYLP